MQIHSFGDWLKHRRKALDLTQAELANQVGCSAAAIRKIEAEERRPSPQIVARLAEVFGIPPKEQASFLRFARGELRAAPANTKEDFPWNTSTTSTHANLPATVTSIVGREQEIALVRKYLLDDTIRLVTLVGPPGIGKTRLSIEAARTVLPDFPNGIFFVSLAPLADPALIGQTIAQSLGHVETKNVSIKEQLKEGIGDKKLLLVLDNCEHLIEDVSSLTGDLLSYCSHLKILTTSRESLRIPGEWMYAIPALNVPEESSSIDMETISAFPAVTLFVERARAVRTDFALDQSNIQAVGSICAQVDGLPLAIELMAARMRLMTPQALLDHLNNQFILSADGMRVSSTRQKTLNDAIAWSYKLLSEEEQRLFAYLSVFSGGFTQAAVEAMFADMFVGTSIPSLLASLLDKSLLQRTFDRKAPNEIRFNMLVTIQHFARDGLQRMGKEEEARKKHFAYFLDLSEQANKEIRGPKQAEWLDRLTAVRDNLRSALEWAIEAKQTEIALQMAGYLSWFWFGRSDLSEGRQWLGKVVNLPEAPHYPKLYSYALAQLALHTWLQSGSKEARPLVEQALSAAGVSDDKWNVAWALVLLGLVLIQESDFIEAQSTLEKSKVLFREIHDDWGFADAILCLALSAYLQGDQAASLALHEESLTEFRQLGDKYFENVALRFIGILQIRQGNLTRGVAALREALLIAQQLDSKYEIAAVLRHVGDAAQAEGNLIRTVHLYWASRNIFDSIGAWQQEDTAEFETYLAPCQAMLGESAFAEAVEQGRAMTMEQAIAYALEDQD